NPVWLQNGAPPNSHQSSECDPATRNGLSIIGTSAEVFSGPQRQVTSVGGAGRIPSLRMLLQIGDDI
ncbi:hypothetical protein ABTD90_21370, partial [Acinetobacter baumannii]